MKLKRAISNYDVGINDADFSAMWNATTPTARVVRGNAEGYIQQVVSLDNDNDRYSSVEGYWAANPQGIVEYGNVRGCHRTEVKAGAWLELKRHS